MSHQYVVVVPPDAPETFAYLADSLKGIRDVQVVVDRRRKAAAPVRPPVDRRATDAPRRSCEAFGCTLVRLEAPVMPGRSVHLHSVRVLHEG